jgi:hypoxanthine phosphoribosyltransferase
LVNKRIFLIDDNAFSGDSLKAIVKFLREYSEDVKTAVIERPVNLREKRPELGIIDPAELAIPVVSKLRYVDKIEHQIMMNLGRLHG